MSSNATGDVSADAFVGLKERLTLMSLNVSNNAIGNVGADVLAKGLKENSMLTATSLPGKLMDEVVTAAMKDALKGN